MNILDIIIGIILILFAFSGFRKGLILEAFYLASYIIGVYGALYFSDMITSWLSELIKVQPEYIALIAFILTFIIFLVVFRYLGHLMSNLAEAIHLGFIDKIGGFVFGILKGLLLTSIFIIILNTMGVDNILDKDTRDQSFLYTRTEELANFLYKNHDIIKDSVEKSFDKGVETIENVIETSLTK